MPFPLNAPSSTPFLSGLQSCADPAEGCGGASGNANDCCFMLYNVIKYVLDLDYLLRPTKLTFFGLLLLIFVDKLKLPSKMAKLFSARFQLAAKLRVVALLLCAQGGFGFSVDGHQESTCEANGSIYYVGEWYFLDSDHCTQCECTTEGSACARTECTSLPAACIHVSHYPTDCCPRCERIGCEYRGVVYELGQNFQPSECEQCNCDSDGIARCLVADCAPPPCVNPLYQPGKCCPECKEGPNCYVDDSHAQVIPAGEPVWVDSCTKCRCHDGQDAGYWEGNRLATCSRLKNCTPEQASVQQN